MVSQLLLVEPVGSWHLEGFWRSEGLGVQLDPLGLRRRVGGLRWLPVGSRRPSLPLLPLALSGAWELSQWPIAWLSLWRSEES